ncbi:hypothetical protein AJ80_07453 [Polytolypa hystricis UAMH7299]|uniref:BTB domain-containing protein n=1 Tax=Polytolypa hystricis (strain UAMH7299) TaxID=1447883 RepID=A0A2B7XPP4_POLH7|nr:hypothetical protein AJ80_07453 [Polytolypa hystricis UAMH7299]
MGFSFGTGALIIDDAEHKAEFLRGFQSLFIFNSKKNSDVTLYLGPGAFVFHAHYAILGVRTKFFDIAKERGFEESKQDEFHLTEHPTHALYRMLEYIYTSDYCADTANLGDSSGPDDVGILKHVRVYILADYFSIHDLKHLCTRKFLTWGGSTSDAFIESIGEIYSMPESASIGMRKAIVETIRGHIHDLYAKESFRKLLKEHAVLGADVVEMLLKSGSGKADASAKPTSMKLSPFQSRTPTPDPASLFASPSGFGSMATSAISTAQSSGFGIRSASSTPASQGSGFGNTSGSLFGASR